MRSSLAEPAHLAPRSRADPRPPSPGSTTAADHPLPGETPVRFWSDGDAYVDLLPSRDLGNSSFVVVDRRSRLAAVIDPTRDVDRYLDRLERSSLTLRWVLDTHLHADFVSGGKELAERGGGRFGLSAEVDAPFDHRPLSDRDVVDLGEVRLRVVRSPGHTPEHLSYLLTDSQERQHVLFSGGSLMAGTAGRPDLVGADRTHGLVREEFTTLRVRYAPLSRALWVLPTHAGGSFCASGARPTSATRLGLERRTNPLFRARTLREFAAAYLPNGPYPAYYSASREINRSGGLPLGGGVPSLAGLPPREVERRVYEEGTTLLDIRDPREFDHRHVLGSLCIPVDGPFSAWVGSLRPATERFVLIDPGARARRAAQIGLLRIGFDRVLGYLDGGVDAYGAAGFPLSSNPLVSFGSVWKGVERGDPFAVVDVREPHEAAACRVPGALNIPLPRLATEAQARLPLGLPIRVHCESGYRATIAVGVLERLGFREVARVQGGPIDWQRSERAPGRTERRRPAVGGRRRSPK